MREVKFSDPDISEQDIANVGNVIRSGWLAHGEYSKLLEKLFCDYTGSKYCTTVSNCTAGLHLSCMAAGFQAGDEVIVPSQTHTATSHAVEYQGAKAVFADVNPITGNISISDIKKKLNENTKGIIPVHMAGYPCKMDEIIKICEEFDLILIEDCAHAVGTRFDGKHAGNFGIAGCFSFYPTKQIATGEGGVVISNDKDVIDFINKHKAFGIDTPPEMRTKPGIYDVRGLGYNYRMTDFQAALATGQMQRYAVNLRRRQENALLYQKHLKKLSKINYPEYSPDNSYFLFQIITSKEVNRDYIVSKLKDAGIGVSIHYATPVPLMSYYLEKYGYNQNDFPNASLYGQQSISLPVHMNLNEEDITYICEILEKSLKKL